MRTQQFCGPYSIETVGYPSGSLDSVVDTILHVLHYINMFYIGYQLLFLHVSIDQRFSMCGLQPTDGPQIEYWWVARKLQNYYTAINA